MKPTWLDEREYPFASHFLEVDGGRLHYVDEGVGEPIVMVHGQPTWSFMYRHLIRDLSPDYRCIALDHIGFGLSDKPRDWSYRPSQHADNLARLVEHLDLDPLTLIVHDWGGPIGLGYAVGHSALGPAWPGVSAAYRGPLERPDDRHGCALFPRMLCVPWLDEIWRQRAVLSGIPARLIWGGADPAFPSPM